MTLHIPILRKGQPYKSLETVQLLHYRTREPMAEISQANAGLIRRDLVGQDAMHEALARIPCAELLRLCARAADLFANDTLPLGDEAQGPEDYVRQTSATTGLPHGLVRRNMLKVRTALQEIGTILKGLSRNLDPRVLDRGMGETGGHALSFIPHAAALGVVLPSHSPGVHALWIPAVVLKTALVLKPGKSEPWTPYRIIQALIKAGVPAEAFGYYPSEPAGASAIVQGCGRSLVFAGSTTAWRKDPRVEVHGPGYSKIVLGPDVADDWERYLDVMLSSILEDSGRSCVNASGIWVPSHGAEIAAALAERLAEVWPRPDEDEMARLAPFPDPQLAARISEAIDRGMEQPGAREVTAAYRECGRHVYWEGATYLLPTIIHCQTPDHSLANREYLFPFASVVEVNPDQLPERLGPSLALTLITSDALLLRRFLSSPLVQRLNLGPIPTHISSWDQPLEGNLFEHLYSRRALQKAGVVA